MPFEAHIPDDFVDLSSEPVLLNSERPWGNPASVFEPLHKILDGSGIKIAIIDTGYQSHSHLPDPIEYVNLTDESDSMRNWHGNHCAGTALGRHGIGVAPGADLIAIKVLAGSQGAGTSDWIAEGVNVAIELGADIISMSLGSGSPYDPTHKAMMKGFGLGIPSYCANGNSGFSGRRNSMGWPARFGDNVFGIGATKGPYEKQSIASFSSGGPQADFAAPGERVLSSMDNNRLGYASGTSMACPYAAGLGALTKEALRRAGKPIPLNYQEWKTLFRLMAVDYGSPGHDQSFGDGILFADEVVTILTNAIQDWGI